MLGIFFLIYGDEYSRIRNLIIKNISEELRKMVLNRRYLWLDGDSVCPLFRTWFGSARWPCGRVTALGLEDRGIKTWLSHTKDSEHGTHCLPAWHSASKGCWTVFTCYYGWAVSESFSKGWPTIFEQIFIWWSSLSLSTGFKVKLLDHVVSQHWRMRESAEVKNKTRICLLERPQVTSLCRDV